MFETMALDDCIVAVPVGEHASQFYGVIKLNETGASILKMLQKDISEEEIIQALAQAYEMPVETLSSDVRQYLGIFREKGLLV